MASDSDSGVGVRLKVGGRVNIEKIEGVGSGEGVCPPQVGVWGLAPEKKINFALKKYAILSKFWYFFPTLQQKVGGLSPLVLKVGGGPIPLSPFSDAYG